MSLTRKSTRSRKSMKAEADRLFSRLIRSRGYCERCGNSDPSRLQTAHIWSRRYVGTRFSELNAFCLCAGCHWLMTEAPVDFAAFVATKRTPSELETLRRGAYAGEKPDYAAILADLRDLQDVQKARPSGFTIRKKC